MDLAANVVDPFVEAPKVGDDLVFGPLAVEL